MLISFVMLGLLVGIGVYIVLNPYSARSPKQSNTVHKPDIYGNLKPILLTTPPVVEINKRSILIGAGIGIMFFVTTNIIMMGIVGFGFGIVVGSVFEENLGKKRALMIREIAIWVEQIRDAVGQRSVYQAMTIASNSAPDMIKEDVQRLAIGLSNATADTKAQIYEFGRFMYRLNDNIVDTISLVLYQALQVPVNKLPTILSNITTSAKEEAQIRQSIETKRTEAVTSLKMACIIVVLFTEYLMIAGGGGNNATFAIYHTLIGQMVLIIVFGVYSAGIILFKSLITPQLFPRNDWTLLTTHQQITANQPMQEV